MHTYLNSLSAGTPIVWIVESIHDRIGEKSESISEISTQIWSSPFFATLIKQNSIPFLTLQS